MNIEVPRLDSVTFEELAQAARERIPRYAPDWTDHNLHDPGITLLELIAWSTDQQVYQLGFVGEAYRSAFAKLLGVTPRLARPARGLIWPYSDVREADLPLATKVTAVRNPDIPYLVDLRCRLSAAGPTGLAGEGRRGRVQLLQTDLRSRATFRFGAYQPDGDGLNTIELRFDRPILQQGMAGYATGIVPLGIEIDDPVLAPEADAGDVPVWAPLRAEYRTQGSGWVRLRVVRDDTHGLLRSGVVAIEVPAVHATVPSALRLSLGDGFHPAPPRVARIALNALPVVQLEHRPGAPLAAGTGLPDQERALPLRGRIPEGPLTPTLRIEVSGPGGWEHWPAADTLAQLGPEDQRITLNAETETVGFGNGINGRIPPLGAAIRHSSYVLTLGAGGNARAGLTWRLPGQGDGSWQNSIAITGGEDAWDTRRTEREAQRRIRHPSLDLADAEIRARLLNLPGFAISRVEILPLRHPALPETSLPGHRTIVVFPELMRSQDLPVADVEPYLRELRARLARNRLAGERLHIMLAETVAMRVRAELLVEDGMSAGEVRQRAVEALRRLLAPLAPPDAAEPQPWPLGRTIDLVLLSGLLAAIPQVTAVLKVELAEGDAPFVARDIPLGRFQVPRLAVEDLTLVRTPGGADGTR